MFGFYNRKDFKGHCWQITHLALLSLLMREMKLMFESDIE